MAYKVIDPIVLTPKDGNGYKYRFSVYSVNNGSFVIAVKNDTAGDLSEAKAAEVKRDAT